MEPSKSIKQFYDGAEIFITGGSGYIGKVLIEKLLRSCPGIKTIYILMRPKRDSTPLERINKISENMLYKTLKENYPEVLKKLHVIEGDAKELNLGISESDVKKLKSCSMIFHSAASVRFDNPLKEAILLNTRGTREVCKLAMTMPNLKAFIHISTAFVQPKIKHVLEEMYPSETDWKTFVNYAETFDEDLINSLTPKLTKFAPNTYTFTKHLAENVCYDYKKEFNLPIVIFRPSIVSASEGSPLPGWCDNLNGPMGFSIVGMLGLVHVLNFSGNNKMDLIPVDVCVKGMIIASHKVWVDRMQGIDDKISLYNATSTRIVSFESISETNDFFFKYPPKDVLGIPSATFSNCIYYVWILRIFRQLIPALFFDTLLCMTRNQPKLLKIQRITINAETSLKYFTSNEFKFDNFKFIDLSLAIPASEKEDFSMMPPILISNMDVYHLAYFIALQEILKELPEDRPKAQRRYVYVVLITRTIHALVFLTAYWIAKKLFLKFF